MGACKIGYLKKSEIRITLLVSDLLGKEARERERERERESR